MRELHFGRRGLPDVHQRCYKERYAKCVLFLGNADGWVAAEMRKRGLILEAWSVKLVGRKYCWYSCLDFAQAMFVGPCKVVGRVKVAGRCGCSESSDSVQGRHSD